MANILQKKNKRRHYILVFFFVIISIFIFSITTYGQTASELQSQIDKKNSDIITLQKEIDSYQAQLKQIGNEKDTLARAIKELDLSARKLATDIKITQGKIDNATLKLQELGLNITSTSNSITDDKTVIRRMLAEIRESETRSFAEMISNKDASIANMWHFIDRTTFVNDAIREKTKALTSEKNILENHKKKVTTTRDELAKLKNNLSNQKKIIDVNARDKNKLLKDTKNKESNYAELLKKNLALKVAFENELSDYESKLKYVLNPKSLPSAHFMSWPIDSVRITQLFGKTATSGRLYASGTHNGVDFGVPLGTPVRATADGIVIGSGNTDLTCPKASYGNWILIGHGNGLTSVFGHLSLIVARTGAIVKRGDVVAYSGSTGYSTGPHLHITVFASDAVKVMQVPSKACSGHTYTQPVAPTNAYLDPMLYLPPYSL